MSDFTQWIKTFYVNNFGKATSLIVAHMGLMTAVWLVAVLLEPWVALAVMGAVFVASLVVSAVAHKIMDVNAIFAEIIERMDKGLPVIYGASYWPAYVVGLAIADVATIYPIVWHYMM